MRETIELFEKGPHDMGFQLGSLLLGDDKSSVTRLRDRCGVLQKADP